MILNYFIISTVLTLFPQDIPEVVDRNWEALLYAPIYDFMTVASLPSYSRASVVGTVHSVRVHPLI